MKHVIYPYFELVSSYDNEENRGLLMPQRSTVDSAGYDFVVAEDTIIPSYHNLIDSIVSDCTNLSPYLLPEVAEITKKKKFGPTLVPTGVKAYIPPREYLQIQVRSSLPLKHWLILANGVGIIDGDYVDNPDNEGHIYFQLINLFPYDILLRKGDKIGQGIFLPYDVIPEETITRVRQGGLGSTGG